jgi:hypothetical protein
MVAPAFGSLISPVRGTLITGRYLSDSRIRHLREATHLPVTIERRETAVAGSRTAASLPKMQPSPYRGSTVRSSRGGSSTTSTATRLS